MSWLSTLDPFVRFGLAMPYEFIIIYVDVPFFVTTIFIFTINLNKKGFDIKNGFYVLLGFIGGCC